MTLKHGRFNSLKQIVIFPHNVEIHLGKGTPTDSGAIEASKGTFWVQQGKNYHFVVVIDITSISILKDNYNVYSYHIETGSNYERNLNSCFSFL